MKRISFLMTAIAGLLLLAVPALAQADPVTPAPDSGLALLTAIIPLLVPAIIAVGKFLAPRIPSWILPYSAPVIGALIEILQHLGNVSAGNALLGAVLGASGVGLREVYDQSKQRLKNGPAVPIVTALLLLGAPLAIGPGCASSPNRTAYVVEGIVVNSVDTATDAFLTLVVNGKVTTAQELQYRAKYRKYQTAQRIVEDLVTSAEPGVPSDHTLLEAATKAVQSASADIIAFVQQFAGP